MQTPTTVDVELSFPWVAIQTKPKAEKTTAAQLAIRGYEIFLPTYQKQSQWSDRVVNVDCPVFPSYLFCRLDTSRPSRVVSAPGVIRIIGRGKDPEPIPEIEMMSIQRLVRCGMPLQPHSYIRKGEPISIVKGPLKGVNGIILQGKGNLKVVVSVALLQRSVAVEMDAEAIRVISAPQFRPTNLSLTA